MKKQNTLSIIVGFFLVFTLMFFPMINATETDMGNFFQNKEIRISEICSNSTSANITSITYPNSSLAVQNVEMNKTGFGEYYYIFSETSELGEYNVNGIINGCENDFELSFNVLEPEDKGLFGLDNFKTTTSLIIFILFLVIAGVMFVIGKPIITSIIVIIEGFILLVNNVSVLLSLILISLGVLIAFMGGEK